MPDRTIAFMVDEEFHREIKMRLAQTGQTLKGYLINLIKADLGEPEEEKKEYTLADAIQKADEIKIILNHIAEKQK